MGYWFTKLETVNQYFPFSLLSICGTLQCTYLRFDHSKASNLVWNLSLLFESLFTMFNLIMNFRFTCLDSS